MPLLWPMGSRQARGILVSVPSVCHPPDIESIETINKYIFFQNHFGNLHVSMLVFSEGSKTLATAGQSPQALPVRWSSLTGTCGKDLRVSPYAVG